MQKLMKDYLEELRRQKKRRRKAAVAVVLLVTLVVGTVTSGLTQYGIAMTEEYHCGLKEHKHTDECYEDVLICGYGDTDDAQEEDNSAEDSAENPEDGSGQPDTTESKEDKAGQSDAAKPQEGHQHTADCYEVEDVLDCDLEESKGHTHDEDCYETEEVMVCEEKEVEGHTHDETCYETEKVLDCKEDHEHTEDCYRTENTLTCGKDETEGHTHGKDCYKSESVLTCKEEESEGHTHGKDCYKQEKVLKCGKEESKEDQTESAASKTTPSDPKTDTTSNTIVDPKADEAQHVHTKDCYEHRLVCGLEEHTHTAECLIDKTADVEDMSVWDAQYEDVEWADVWGEDLVTAANKQIGYEESLDNYQIAEDGSHQGYTRYGEFAGDPYMDWDTAFVNFCMHYAGLTESGLFPDKTDAAEWKEEFVKLQEEREEQEEHKEYLTAPEDYTPRAGDLIFFDRNADDEEEENEEEVLLQMGIVSSYEEEENEEGKNEIKVIEGDSDHAVKENTYDADDVQIVQYLKITELETDYKAAQEDPSGLPDEKNENGLTPEEQAQVDAVIALIEALPTMEAVTERFTALEEDEEGYAAYYQELYEQVLEAKNAYDALTEAQKLAVTNAEKLMQYEWLWTDSMDETEGPEPDHQARITSFTITRTVDGTAPFDNHMGHTPKCYEVGHDKEPEYLTCKQHVYGSDEEESAAGDDRGADNLVVRTFDSVNYKFRVTMDTYSGTSGGANPITDARVKLQVILPTKEEQATFNLEAMTWVDTAPDYKPEIKDIIIDGNGGFKFAGSKDDSAINGQLLTCWKHLESGRAVIPGFFENNVTVDVKSMKNGETFAPIFYSVLEGGFEYDIDKGEDVPQPPQNEGEDYGYTDEHICHANGHEKVEMFRADAPEIRVSAAPKYNIQIKGADSEKRQYNFQDGVGGDAVNYDKGFQTGRMVRLGVTLQLYNDNASKGLKGIQLPDEDVPITFDLKLESVYQSHKTPQGETEIEIPVTDKYTPLLWSCGPNNSNSKYGDTNIDGRKIYDGYWGNGLVPYSNGGGEYSCKESGTWEATQNGSTIHVTVSGYKVDITSMPSYNHGQDAEVDNVTYGANIGCFSSGVLWILQPFNKDPEADIEINPTGNREPEFDVVKWNGQGVFHTTINDSEMKITTSDAHETIVVRDDAQMCNTDDYDTRHLELLLPGVMINRVRYSDRDISKGVGVNSIRNGRDYASLGSEVWLMGGFTFYADRKEENQFYYGTNLVKFYGSAIEPVEEQPIERQWAATAEGDGGNYVPGHSHLQTYFSGGARASEISVYYAAKHDGTDWKDDREMKQTYEDCYVEIDDKGAVTSTNPNGGLDFYKHLADLKADKKICVGILYCFKGSGNDVTLEQNDPGYECFHKAIVKSDEKLVDDGTGKPMAYAMVATSRVWTKKMFEADERWGKKALTELEFPVWTFGNGTTLDSFPAGYMKSGNIEDSTWYQRTQYFDDGRGVSRDHNSDWSHWGDTMLLIGYRTYITKELMQKTGGKAKEVFDLDGNQRVVDFKLTPSTGYNLAISQGEGSNPNITIPVITIIDTLPQYLRYREGSAYLGGTYRQTASNGGRQGEILNGTELGKPVKELLSIDGDETKKVEALAWNISKPSSVDNEPVIIESEDGTQTLIWRFYNREVGDKLPVIYYSADIGKRGDPFNDVPEGTTNLVNKVRITAKLDRRHPSVENKNYAEVGIAVTRGNAGAYGKYSLQNAVEVDGTIGYVVYYDNNTNDPISSMALMDNMPFNGVNGSKFTGTYKLTNWKLDKKLCETSTLTVWYTTDPKYKGVTLSDQDSDKNYLISEISGSPDWKQAQMKEDGTLSFPGMDTMEFGKKNDGKEGFLAWAVLGGLSGGECIDISMSIQLIPDKPTKWSDVTSETYHYVNLFSTKDTVTEVDTPVVRRTLEGLTWMDYNRNGKQDQHQNVEEDKLPKVKVTLLKMTDAPEGTSEEEWAKDISHYEPVLWPEGTPEAKNPVTILTGQQISLRQTDCEAIAYEASRYKFTDLPAGYFAVEFTSGEGNADISRMRATIYDSTLGGVTDENDSDGVPVYAGNDEKNGKLEQTYIAQIEMEDADTIFYNKYPNYTQISPYHDSGFYYNPELNLHKVGENWSTALSGAVFMLTDSKGQTIAFNRDEDGNYRFPISLGEDVVSGARYYIQYVQAPSLVIGTSGTKEGDEFQLCTKKEKEDTQLFELFVQQDGTFSFRHCATKMWFDFSGTVKKSDNKAVEIHLWGDSNVPTANANQKWYVIPNGKGQGQYLIQAAVKRNTGENKGFVDANGAATSAGTLIWGYEGNGTPAQDWQLIPENENSNLKVDGSGLLTIKDLLPGEYTLTELETPPGCALPDHPVKITVNNDGTVNVSENATTEIARVEGTGQNNNGTVTTDVKVRNFELYTLPSTGGIGIYWYCIGGVLLMFAGVLIQYKRKYAGRC